MHYFAIDSFEENSSPQAMNDLLAAELSFTTAALRQHPKVYWIWNHRRWCLENVPDGPGSEGQDEDPQGWRKANWAKEMFVVEKMLDADARNFHAWSYRRYVLESMPEKRSPEDEIAYTKRKIESNFSNFSAWHQRSKVYGAMWESEDTQTIKKTKDREFELVQHALYVDPNDQSGWLYHRWLIGNGDDVQVLEREVGVIEEILELEPDSKWCLETLVHYKRLLGEHKPSDALRKDCVRMLDKLQVIDAQRRNCYLDQKSVIHGS